MLHFKTFCVVLLLTVTTLSLVHADPWPDYSSHTDLVSFVQVSPINKSGTLWDYQVTVLPGAYDLGHGGLDGIKALVIYPNGGSPEPALDGWSGDGAFVRANWDTNGGWHVQQGAFGYHTNDPASYINAGESNELVGTAQFTTGYAPPSHVFLVHVADNDGYTYWARPTVIPEPGLAATCAAGFIPFLGLIRRRRR
jgi:hypothetical protein